MNDDGRRKLQPNRREIPNSANAAGDHQLSDRLGLLVGHGDNADVNVHALRQIGQLGHGEYLLASDRCADLGRIGVESGDDTQAALVEAVITQQCGAQMADAREKGILGVVPAEKMLNLGN